MNCFPAGRHRPPPCNRHYFSFIISQTTVTVSSASISSGSISILIPPAGAMPQLSKHTSCTGLTSKSTSPRNNQYELVRQCEFPLPSPAPRLLFLHLPLLCRKPDIRFLSVFTASYETAIMISKGPIYGIFIFNFILTCADMSWRIL